MLDPLDLEAVTGIPLKAWKLREGSPLPSG